LVYGGEYEEQPKRPWLLGVASAVVGAAVVLGAYYVGQVTRPSDSAASPPASQGARALAHDDTGTLLPAQPSTDPVQSAVAWLRAYRSMGFSDATPGAWLGRVQPVVTGELAEQYQGYEDGSAGAGWSEYVRRMCLTSVDGAGGVIPDEAPRTPDAVSVQVGGTVTTRCADKQAPPQPDEAVGATVNLRLGADGFWRVEKRLY
jgi:hypothetical protein